jgi:dTDP-4-dehydrorhamnose reductase
MIPLDVADGDAVRRVFEEVRPQVVIHCAAETRVDVAEIHPDETERANAQGAANVAAATESLDARLLYISTDAVFDGSKGHYRESDEPNPVNVYGRTKLAGEASSLRLSTDSLVVRTNLIGWGGPRRPMLLDWIVDTLESGGTVGGFVDARFAPLYVDELARLLLELAASDERGVVHLGASDALSKFDFARLVARTLGVDWNQVTPERLADRTTIAARPLDTSLDSSAIADRMRWRLPTVAEAIARAFAARAIRLSAVTP